MGEAQGHDLVLYADAQDSLSERRAPADGQRLWAAAMATLSTATKRAYLGDWARFADWWGAPDVPTALAAFITLSCGQARELVLEWRKELEGRGLKTATVARAVRAMNAVIKRVAFAEGCDWTLDVPAPRVETYRDTRGPTGDEWRTLIEHTNEDESPQGWRDYALLLLMRDSALRRAEVCAIDYPGDVDLKQKRIAVLGKGKTDKLWHPISERAKQAISDWIEERGTGEGALFCRLAMGDEPPQRLDGNAIYYIVRKRGESAGVDVKPHGLRHSGITAAAKRWTGNMMGLVRYARHTDPKVTQIYVDDVEDAPGEIAELVGSDDENEEE